MLLVILGAGASFDSAISRPVPERPRDWFRLDSENRLPLANQLFDEREVFKLAVRNHPHFLPIVHRLRLLDGRGIEQVLDELVQESIAYQARKAHLLAIRYYIKVAISSCTDKWLGDVDASTNYRVLLDLIQQFQVDSGPTLLATFNYDCMLESALKNDFRYSFARIDDYVDSARAFSLFKLHGSTDWARLVKHQRTNYPELIHAAKYLEYFDNIMKDDEAAQNAQHSWAYVPAIAVPMQTKTDFECPKTHREKLESYLPKVTRILTIGWRGMEEHFIKMLNAHLQGLKALLVVSKDDAGQIAEQLRLRLTARAGRAMDIRVYEEGFSNFINRPSEIREFLQR